MDPPSPRSPSVFAVHGLQGFFYSFPLPGAGAWDFSDSEGNKSISLGSDSLCTWAERSQLGHQLVSLTKQPELSDGGGGFGKEGWGDGEEGECRTAGMMQSGFSGQAQAGKHGEKYYKHVEKQKVNVTTTTQENRKGD